LTETKKAVPEINRARPFQMAILLAEVQIKGIEMPRSQLANGA